MTIIDKFDGTYRFLSNFWLTPVVFDGRVYLSVEHAYQAAKTLVDSDRYRIWRAQTPGQAKRMGKSVTLRPDWDDVKLQVMAFLLVQKFKKGTLLGSMLEATGDAYLMEGNTWGDTFWGVCDGEGNNYLGELLMLIRSDNRPPRSKVCSCGKGHVSRFDGKCGHCRTKKEKAALDRLFQVRKCWCGNPTQRGAKFCTKHEPDSAFFEGVEDTFPNIMDAS